ncbi:MAG: carboxynorspermidine decarboxylase [Methanomassiliicoccaceae archaeon]|nr:carboxynorspermidine decarboxylase [Methanomassiliicoccaceae archaeon]
MNRYILNEPTPYYVIDEALLIKNLKVLRSVKERTGCRILLAQKAFSCFHLYPLIAEYLDGATASGLFEARLGHERFRKENHVFSAAYREEEMDEINEICDHIIFNSFGQLRRFAPKLTKKLGLRINPQVSTQKKDMYDPCAPFSRLGVRAPEFEKNEDLLKYISGFHFHTLCGQNSDALEVTLRGAEKNFSQYFDNIEWLNFGGGHHITRSDYDVELLVSLINEFKDRYNVQVYLEPGEAVVLNAGFLVSSVLDVVENIKRIAILDTSAACHMPDVIEGPYKPRVTGEGGTHQYRLAGCTCLAGDVIGDYSLQNELRTGDKIVIEDMALYTMVKNNTFNGIGLPSIHKLDPDGKPSKIKGFGYEDFIERLS